MELETVSKSEAVSDGQIVNSVSLDVDFVVQSFVLDDKLPYLVLVDTVYPGQLLIFVCEVQNIPLSSLQLATKVINQVLKVNNLLIFY